MKAAEAKRLKELKSENARLTKLVAKQALDIDALNELAEETSDPGPSPQRRLPTYADGSGFRATGLPGRRCAPVRHRLPRRARPDEESRLHRAAPDRAGAPAVADGVPAAAP